MLTIPGTLTLGAWLCAAQAPATQEPAAPDPALTRLQTHARAWIAAEQRYETADSMVDRKAAAPVRTAARRAFDEAMAAFEAERGRSLLLDADALATVFEDVFAPAPPSVEVGAVTLVDEPGASRAQLVPEGYDASRSYPMVLALTGREQRGGPDAARRYVETTWGAASEREQVLVIAPLLPADLDFDGVGEPATVHERHETQRMAAALRPLGAAWQQVHAARDRLVLDCGRGASAFGLRVLARLPDRFAGVVLRWPVLDPALRYEALEGIPVLLIRNDETAAACDVLKERLDALSPGSCRILTPPTDYPYGEEVGIGEWARQQRRVEMARRVVVAPSHRRSRNNRWVRIGACDEFGDPPYDAAPLVIAEADPDANRITVTTRGVQEFTLLLGPALVDVRDFTLVVDGKEERVQLSPSLTGMVQRMRHRNDPAHLFTAQKQVDLR